MVLGSKYQKHWPILDHSDDFPWNQNYLAIQSLIDFQVHNEKIYSEQYWNCIKGYLNSLTVIDTLPLTLKRLDFTTPSFNPGFFNYELFNHELFNPKNERNFSTQDISNHKLFNPGYFNHKQLQHFNSENFTLNYSSTIF